MERNQNTTPDQAEVDEQAPDAPDIDGPTESSDLNELHAELEAERKRSAEFLDQAQRARAEFVNFRRRTEEDLNRMREQAGERIISRLLPAIDDLDRAISSMDDSVKSTAWAEGMFLVQKKIWSTLENEGVRPIEALGQPFDPSVHEAVSMQQGSGGEQVVVQEFQRGYLLGDRVIRPSMVVVGSADDLPEDARETRNQTDDNEGNEHSKQEG